MGYLIATQPFTVPFGGSVGTRSFLVGVNKGVTPDMAEHWYVKAAGARYVEKLEDAHKNTPDALASVRRARSDWEQATRESMRATATAMGMRRDLENLEKEFGVDTKALDKAFKDATKDEADRLEELHGEWAERMRAQEEADASSTLSPAEAERKAAGSAEVANTAMDGPAKADAKKTAAETGAQITAAAGAPASNPAAGASEVEKKAAGSDEAANTHPDGKPVDEKREAPKPSETKAADAKDAKDGKTEVAEAKADAKK